MNSNKKKVFIVMNPDLSKISLFSTPNQISQYTTGYEILEFLSNSQHITPLGDSEFSYFVQNPQEIPKEWQGFSVCFWGEIEQHIDTPNRFVSRYVKYLRLENDGSVLTGMLSVDNIFNSKNPGAYIPA